MNEKDKYAITIVDVTDKPIAIIHQVIEGWSAVEQYLHDNKEEYGTVPPTSLAALKVAAENGAYQDNELNTQKDEEWTVYTVCIEGPIER